MTIFVWAKMQAAAGETLEQIVQRKEAERRAGDGLFWWGIGTSLGEAVETTAASRGEILPILFSRMLSKPKKQDAEPESVCVWDGWRNRKGITGSLPEHVLVTGGTSPSGKYYALTCFSSDELALKDHGPFDPSLCRTMRGKVPGSSQVTSLLHDTQPGSHARGIYRIGFRAQLSKPWCVQLTDGRLLSDEERHLLRNFKEGDDWMYLTKRLRCI